MTSAERALLARAVASAVFNSLLNAERANTDAERDRWFRHADKLEGKFTTEYGVHYSRALEAA